MALEELAPRGPAVRYAEDVQSWRRDVAAEDKQTVVESFVTAAVGANYLEAPNARPEVRLRRQERSKNCIIVLDHPVVDTEPLDKIFDSKFRRDSRCAPRQSPSTDDLLQSISKTPKRSSKHRRLRRPAHHGVDRRQLAVVAPHAGDAAAREAVDDLAAAGAPERVAVVVVVGLEEVEDLRA